ncbi:hypothetical protein C8J56DRAFT_1112400, partial [Mycena floridula]
QHFVLTNISTIPVQPYPDSPSPDDHASARLTVTALDVFAHQMIHDLLADSRMHALSKRNLQKLISCIPFLRQRLQCGRHTNGEWGLQETLLHSVSRIFMHLFKDPEFNSILLSSFPEIFGDLTQIWVLEEDMKPMLTIATVLSAGLGPDDDYHLNGVFRSRILTIADKYIHPFLLACQPQPSTFILRRIISIFDTSTLTNPDMYSLAALIDLMAFISISDCMSGAFWELGSVKLVCHMMRRLSSRKILSQRHAFDIHLSSVLFQTCIKYLAVSMALGGLSQVKDCLGSQMLVSMMKRRHFMPSGPIEDIIDDGFAGVLIQIEPYLLYPSILHLASKSTRTIIKFDFHNWTSSHMEFSRAWTHFTSLLEPATLSKSELLALPYDWATCYNTRASDSLDDCDPECSKLRCRRGRKSREITFAGYEGLAEARAITCIDFAYIVRRVCKDTNPRVNPRTLVLVLDYRKTPHTTSIMSEGMFRHTEAKNLEESEFEDKIAAADQDLGFLVFSVSRGFGPGEWKNFELRSFENGWQRYI